MAECSPSDFDGRRRICHGSDDLGPAWYPIALAVTALPLAWLGGALYLARASAR
jgi:hypothetical protein